MSSEVEPSPFPTLTTERLVLREIVEDDAPSLFAIHGDADAMRWFGTDPLATLEDAHKLVQTFAGWRPRPMARSSAVVGSSLGIAAGTAAPSATSCRPPPKGRATCTKR